MKNKKKMIYENHAQVGIGTLIIFIAMVLVAAVAAAVLISTSGVLQQKAQQTGEESISQVSSNLNIISIVGDRGGTTNDYFSYVNITVEPAAGAGDIDLSQLKIVMANATERVVNITYASANLPSNANQFGLVIHRDADNSFSTSDPVINAGDLVVIVLKPGTTVRYPEREPYGFTLIPETGSPVTSTGTTPASYGVNRYITLT